MSSSKQKKQVHYSSTTKGGKSSSKDHHRHLHKDSKDSGVGSSSASDRASLGTSPNESPFSSQEIHTQRLNPTAVNEALDAANERIRELENMNAQLEAALSKSNRDNRALKRDRSELENEVNELKDALEEKTEINSRLASQRNSPSNTAANTVANSSAPRRNDIPHVSIPRQAASRRFSTSTSRSGAPPLAPQPPPNNTPNPFTPLHERPGAPFARPAPHVTYAQPVTPSTVSYSPPYSPVPAYTTTIASRTNPKRSSTQERMYPNDGNYHPYPV